MLRTDVDTGVNAPLIALLLPELDQKLESVMANLEEVRITGFFPAATRGCMGPDIFVAHSVPAFSGITSTQTSWCMRQPGLRMLRASFDAHVGLVILNIWRKEAREDNDQERSQW
jgi:hypothetical protein